MNNEQRAGSNEQSNEQETRNDGNGSGAKTSLYSLIPLADFKSLLGIDDREDVLSRYCLTTATYTIEQYCKRRMLHKKRFEFLPFYGDYVFPLREYPVREIIAMSREQGGMSKGELIGTELYRVIPDCGDLEDIPGCLSVSSALGLVRGVSVLKVRYWAGYAYGEVGYPCGVPADLASACLELAAWNMSRYRGRRIGMTGNVRGSGKDGEHLETSMPENVRQLLEPYKRRVI
jgi:hypothetical protein